MMEVNITEGDKCVTATKEGHLFIAKIVKIGVRAPGKKHETAIKLSGVDGYRGNRFVDFTETESYILLYPY